jgi:hypothetical protein
MAQLKVEKLLDIQLTSQQEGRLWRRWECLYIIHSALLHTAGLDVGSLCMVSALSMYAHTPSFQCNNVVVPCVFDFTTPSSFP